MNIIYTEKNEYYSCENYNSINNCKICDNKNSCNICKEGYTFIKDDKSSCENIENLGNYYFKDLENNIFYRKCSDYIDNCNTCSSKDECLSCIDQYGLYNNKKECIDINNNKYYKK